MTKESRIVEMELLIKRWQESNLSIKAFCKENDIAPSVFHYWYKKLKPKEHNSQNRDNPAFTAIKIANNPIRTSLPFAEIESHGKIVRIYTQVEAHYLQCLLK